MENLVDKIIEIDKDADKKVQDAINKKREFMEEIEAKKKKIIEEINEHAKVKIKAFEESQIKENEEFAQNLEQKKNNSLKQVKETFDKNHDKWLDTIINGAKKVDL